jgi:maleate isomerase/arylmalonate decarboxylase
MTAARHLSAYGPRARLGVIVPPTNTVNEAEWARMIPEGVTFHTTRMPLHSDTTSEAGRASLRADLDSAIGLLAQAHVDVVAYACTAGSMATPAESIPDEMTARSGTPCITTAAAIVAALRALGVRRLAVATPYHAALNDHEARFLADHGFDVTAIKGLGLGANGPQDYPRIARTPLDEVRAHALSVLGRDEQALLVTCTDFPTLPLIAGLEAETGLPVVTSNSATLWQALRRAGIHDAVPQGGQLFYRNAREVA